MSQTSTFAVTVMREAIPDMLLTSRKSNVLISDEAKELFTWINFLLCAVIALFGTGANTINIICFVKQGLKDPINVSFLGLAVADLGSQVTLIWTSICMIPAFQKTGVPFDPPEFQYLTSAWPHVVCTRVTSWITALVTLERCLCITMPLKVKNIITSKRVAIIITAIFVIIIGGVSPMYYTSRFVWGFSPEQNRTMIKVVYTKDRAFVESIALAITNVFIPLSAYIMVIICTITLVITLRNKAKWRAKCVKSEITSDRDQRVAKMVVGISILFIACFMPLCGMFIAMAMEPELSLGGRYINTLTVLAGLCMLLEDTNSAMNIFIYYRMSSKYRAVFRELFRREKT